jgi:hypothetical protein
MQTISKQRIGNWILLDYLAQKQVYQDKVTFFQKKYNTDLENFENQLESNSTESFESWDDYIEWKAYNKFLSEINLKISEVKNGYFQMAG